MKQGPTTQGLSPSRRAKRAWGRSGRTFTFASSAFMAFTALAAISGCGGDATTPTPPGSVVAVVPPADGAPLVPGSVAPVTVPAATPGVAPSGVVAPVGAGADPSAPAPAVGGPDVPGVTVPASGAEATACQQHGQGASPAAVVRLSRAEYEASVQDLLGQLDFEAGQFIQPTSQHGFVGAVGVLGSTAQLEGYFAEAQRIAEVAVDALPELSNPADLEDDNFVRGFLQSFGKRVLRRPLAEADVANFFDIYTQAKTVTGGAESLTWALTGLFSSPEFIYRVERVGVDAGDGLADLGAFDRASRLSYFLTGSTPDAALLQAAEQGELQTPAGVRTQAERLMTTPRGRQQLARFVLEWLELEGVTDRSDALLGAIDPDNQTLADDLKRSIATAVMTDSGAAGFASFESLLTQQGLFLNESLAASLGENAGGADFSLVPAEGRFGVLTHPALMALHSSESFAKATIRGVFVMEKVVCQHPPEPTDDVVSAFPEFTEDDWLPTQRQTLEALHQVGSCRGCHTLIDGFGFPFENYDSQGNYVTQEQSPQGDLVDIDSSGRVLLDGVLHDYENAEQFSALLAQSEEVHACMSQQLLRFALRREEDARTSDACTIEQVTPRFGAGSTLKDAFIEFTQTPAFLRQRVSAGTQTP